MAATAKIIPIDRARRLDTQLLKVKLGVLVTAKDSPRGLVTVHLAPQAIQHIKDVLSDLAFAMSGRRRQFDLPFGRVHSFVTVIEPYEVYYSLCPTRMEAEVESVFRWAAPTLPPAGIARREFYSITPSVTGAQRTRSVRVRGAAAVAACLALFGLLNASFWYGRHSLEVDMTQAVLANMAQSVQPETISPFSERLVAPLSSARSRYFPMPIDLSSLSSDPSEIGWPSYSLDRIRNEYVWHSPFFRALPESNAASPEPAIAKTRRSSKNIRTAQPDSNVLNATSSVRQEDILRWRTYVATQRAVDTGQVAFAGLYGMRN